MVNISNYLLKVSLLVLATLVLQLQLLGQITPPGDCALPAPAWIQTTNTTPTTISLEWAAVSGADAYKVEAFDGGTSVFDGTTTATQITITGLNACTFYDIKITPLCPNGVAGESGIHGARTQCIVIDDIMANFQSLNKPNFRDVVCNEVFDLPQTDELIFKINNLLVEAGIADKYFAVFESLTIVPTGGSFTSLNLLHIKHENPVAGELGYILANEWNFFPCNYNGLFATYIDLYRGRGSSNPSVAQTDQEHIYLGRLTLNRFIENGISKFSICPNLVYPNYSIQVIEPETKVRNSDDTVQQGDKIQVAPNPFSDNLIVSFASPVKEKTTFVLYDLNGKMLKAEQVAPGTSEQIYIPTVDLAPGTYIARWSNTQDTQTFKVVKMN